MKTLFIALRSLVFMSAFALLWGWLALSVRRFDRSLGVFLPAWTPTLGIVLLAGCGILALACGGAFVVRGQGTPAPFDAPRKFVAVGPYRYCRNPMYVGGLALLAGLGLSKRSVAMLVFSVAWLLLAHLVVVAYEEPVLREKFGKAYEEYCQAVSRWIPKPRPRSGF